MLANCWLRRWRSLRKRHRILAQILNSCFFVLPLQPPKMDPLPLLDLLCMSWVLRFQDAAGWFRHAWELQKQHSCKPFPSNIGSCGCWSSAFTKITSPGDWSNWLLSCVESSKNCKLSWRKLAWGSRWQSSSSKQALARLACTLLSNRILWMDG